jgi:hypothetical protein
VESVATHRHAKETVVDLTGKSVIVTGSSKGSATPSIARRRPGGPRVINSVSSGEAGEMVAAALGACMCKAMSAGPHGRSPTPPSSGGRVWTVSSTTPGVTVRVPLAAVEALTVDHWITVLTTSATYWADLAQPGDRGHLDDPSLARRRRGPPSTSSPTLLARFVGPQVG